LVQVEVLKWLKNLYKEKAGKEWSPDGGAAKEDKKPKENKANNAQQPQANEG